MSEPRESSQWGGESDSQADQWAAGSDYEAFMGRWSRPLAHEFVAWLAPRARGHWLEVGCGTGALTGAICKRGDPATLVACDPSPAFIANARNNVADGRASFVPAGVDQLPAREGCFDYIVSGLVLNFLPDPVRALQSMIERLSSRGVIGAYVWDYSEGMEFLRRFWDAATALDPDALSLDEGLRFLMCRPAALKALFEAAGLEDVEVQAIEVPTHFHHFGDFWRPFLGAIGPAPAYVASLDPARREALRTRLERELVPGPDGMIRMRARAWAARGRR